ncbi:UNVERIFIED_CONTAM: NPL4-like protein [Sesamum calycinum]|uniref:NPL4-like protein n=1 Tax=Sesamum calycinum TaxID=2727403 RepID=A0AAW2LRH4_9LAMI
MFTMSPGVPEVTVAEGLSLLHVPCLCYDCFEYSLALFLDLSHREQEIPNYNEGIEESFGSGKGLPFVKRISDFHLLLLLARFLDINADVPALAGCVQTQATIPEGYQLLIESLASAS